MDEEESEGDDIDENGEDIEEKQGITQEKERVPICSSRQLKDVHDVTILPLKQLLTENIIQNSDKAPKFQEIYN